MVNNNNLILINKILKNISKKLNPDIGIIKYVDVTVNKINVNIKNNNVRAECVKGGSIAKGTFLKNDHDVDLFIRFNAEYRQQDISKLTEKILQQLKFDISRIHGSRDYFQFQQKIKSFLIDYEVIPVLKIHPTNYMDAQNVTDLSPEHVVWVKKYTEKNPELTREIRLAKQFCKANNVYGAESYINGFSGHILDILIIHYGSFINLVKKFASLISLEDVNIKNPLVIDHENNLKNPLLELNKSKISPLIIVDPIQKNRNAAAALGIEKLLMFTNACKKFLEKPSEEFFKIKKYDMKKEISEYIREYKKDSGIKNLSLIKTIIFNIKNLEGSKDVVGTKILKAYEDIIKHLGLEGFIVLKSGWNFEFEKKSAQAYLLLENKDLSEFVEHTGPPLMAKIDCEKFKKIHSENKITTKNNRLYVVVKRKYRNPEAYLKKLLNEDFIKSRVRSISYEKK